MMMGSRASCKYDAVTTRKRDRKPHREIFDLIAISGSSPLHLGGVWVKLLMICTKHEALRGFTYWVY